MREFTVVTVPQRSPEWFAARLGRVTGSAAGDMIARTKSGWSTSRRNLLMRLALERLTGRSMDRTVTTPAMQDGIDREGEALARFEALSGAFVQRTGFLQHPELMAGCSLDGHLGDYDTLVSVKCRQPEAHWAFLRHGTIPADALAQMRHEAWLTGASRHIYFTYNPDFEPELQTAQVELTAADLGLAEYDGLIRAFLAEVDTEIAALRTMRQTKTVLEASL